MNAYLAMRYRVEPVIAVLLLVVLSPVLVAVAAWVLVTDGRPVLFAQPRVHPEGPDFRVLKFRTYRRTHRMEDEQLRDDGTLASSLDDPDLLPGARLVRVLGLDELPQLVNIARGQMSFIGPRPLPVHLRELQARRAPIRLGVLGLAQANDRRRLGLPERLELDNRYAVSASVRLDALILLRTAVAVLKGEE